MPSHYHFEACSRKTQLAKNVEGFIQVIAGPLTIPYSTFEYLRVLSMPQVSFEFLQNARDVQTLPYRDDYRVHEIELGIGILPENFCRERGVCIPFVSANQ
jgi:hypothetical protein